MSTGSGKRPASSRGQARYSRRDKSSDRSPPRALTPASPRAPTPLPGIAGAALHGGAAIGQPQQPTRLNRRKPTQQELPMLDARAGTTTKPQNVPGRGAFGRGAQERQVASAIGTSGKAAGRSSADNDVPRADAFKVAARRGLFAWRRSNRRITVESHSPAVWIVEKLAALARRLFVVGKILAALAVLAAAVLAGRVVVEHVVASPRFALAEIRLAPTTHVGRDEIVALSTVVLGDRLLALDTDVIAARLARHPWIAAARVRRQLPSTLVIEVTERRASAVAVIGGLYLLDEKGHPFKHATLQEADGHVVLTGISRGEYGGLPGASEAAFREALALLAAYKHPDSLATARHGSNGGGRPPLSEIHIDPRTGFSLYLYDGGTEIRLGRGALADKLARLDEILAEFGPRGVSTLRVVHLDGPAGDRVPIRLALPPPADESSPSTAPAVEPARSTQGSTPLPPAPGRRQSKKTQL